MTKPRKSLYLYSLILSLSVLPAHASFEIEGELSDSSGPVSASGTAVIQVLLGAASPHDSCVLYQENVSITSNEHGQFTAMVGEGTRSGGFQTVDLGSLFNNDLPQYCRDHGGNAESTAQDPSAHSSRALKILVTAGGKTYDLQPMAISAVPVAAIARKVGKHSEASLLRVEDSETPADITPLSSANFDKLKSLLNISLDSEGKITSNSLAVGATPNGITALTGDITASGTGSVSATISDNAVTTDKINANAVSFGKMQTIANAHLLGRHSAGEGDIEVITIGTGLSLDSGTLNATAVDVGVTSVGVNAPITKGGTETSPTIGIQQASGSQSGYLSSADFNTFSGKLSSISSGNVTTALGFTPLSPTLDQGKVYIGDENDSAQARHLKGKDLKAENGTDNFWPGTNCSAGQILSYDVTTDKVSCANLDAAGVILDGGNSPTTNPLMIGTNNGQSLRFKTANTTRIIIDNTGKIGIGTSPVSNALLNVNGNILANRVTSPEFISTSWSSVETDNTINPQFSLRNANGTSWSFIKQAPTGGFTLGYYNSSVWSYPLNVATNGNVGIGTTTLNAKLKVEGDIVGRVNKVTSGKVVDFSSGNLQELSSACITGDTGIDLQNMKAGGVYTLIIPNTSSPQTCNFTAGTGTANSGFRYPPGHGAAIPEKQTLYSFMVTADQVFISWIPGYNAPP